MKADNSRRRENKALTTGVNKAPSPKTSTWSGGSFGEAFEARAPLLLQDNLGGTQMDVV